MIEIQCITVGPLSENCYVVSNTENHECVLIDPGAEPECILPCIGNRSPRAVLLTHAHFDHIGAADALCDSFRIPLYVHEMDAPKLTDEESNCSHGFGCSVQVHTPPTLLSGGEILNLAGVEFHVLHTPGHSAGGLCYLLPEIPCVFTGDTLFSNGYGRTDFADGDFTQLFHSLRTLFRLTPKMTAYPGHGEVGFAGTNPRPSEE